MHDLKSSNFTKTKLFHMELSRTPPELLLRSLPLHRPEPSGLVTPPPFRVPVAIPFIWEEEPGRPRKESIFIKPDQKPFSTRSLELPPRMVAEELKMKADRKNATSPTSVLDVMHSISRSRSFSRCHSFSTGNKRRKGDEGNEISVKLKRFKRHQSFIDVSMHATSRLLLGIYKSLRQVVPWRRT